MSQKIEQIADMMEVGMRSIVDFRRVFMPAPVESPPAKFHYQWSDILLEGNKHFAIEGFRNSGKSTLINRAFPMYLLTFPSRKLSYVIFIMSTTTQAQRALKQIKEEWLANPILSANKVEIREDNLNTLCVIVKDIHGDNIEVRMEVYGKGSSIRGALYKQNRPQVIVMDDVQGKDDAKSETTLENDWDWFLSDIMFLGDKTRIFMIGNNLGEGCLIERVFAHNDDLHFSVIRIPVLNIRRTVSGEEIREPSWAERDSVEDIDRERQEYERLGKADIWFAEKMCMPVAPQSQIFREEYLRFYSPTKIHLSDFNIYTTVDLAISKKETADYTVIMTVGVNKDNQWFILDIKYGRFDPTETMDNIFKTVSKYRPLEVGIEKIAFQSAMEHFLIKEMPSRNMYFRITPLSAKGQKEERIKLLQPRFRAGSIWLPGRYETLNGVPTWLCDEDWYKEFKAEYLAWPHSLHDDFLDALAYIEHIAKRPSASRVRFTEYKMRRAGSL